MATSAEPAGTQAAALDEAGAGTASSHQPFDTAVATGSHAVEEVGGDLAREVYCVLGMPIDVVEMSEVLRKIGIAATQTGPFVISTPNIHFLINCRRDRDFRESVLASDLCPADGTPLVWIARLIGIPLKHRVAGSDIFDALKTQPSSGRPLRVFLFGSTNDACAAAAARLNATPHVLACVGWLYPGFGTVEELSTDDLIEKINVSKADFLVVALGARKGQLWLRRNHHRIRIPIRAHLGAVINFQAGTVKRAPPILRQLGLEWLWRIKEEPYLWRRYLNDALALLYLLATRIAPLAIETRRSRYSVDRIEHNLVIDASNTRAHTSLVISGSAVARNVAKALPYFRNAIDEKKLIIIDVSKISVIDVRFFGLLLMLRKQAKAQGVAVRFEGVVSNTIARSFHLNGLGHLLP